MKNALVLVMVCDIVNGQAGERVTARPCPIETHQSKEARSEWKLQ